jgi:hypothetical protein
VRLSSLEIVWYLYYLPTQNTDYEWYSIVARLSVHRGPQDLAKFNDAASQKTGSQLTEPHTRAISITEGFVLAQAIFRES